MALTLASTSPIRRQILEAAGVSIDIRKPDVDESAVKRWLSDPAEIALELARAKALSVSADDWVIGSDSVVSVGGEPFDKPRSREEAADHLRRFSGEMMRLTSGVALARDGRVEWDHVDSASLQLRILSDDFIESYLAAEWPEVSYCVGVFRLEGPGVQLFERIEGSHFTILGMPLLPLLAALRERGLLLA